MCSMRLTLLTASCFALVLGLSPAVQAQSDVRLAVAVKNQDATAVKALLKQKVNVNAPDVDGSTALQWAAHWNDIDTVKAPSLA